MTRKKYCVKTKYFKNGMIVFTVAAINLNIQIDNQDMANIKSNPLASWVAAPASRLIV